MNPTSTQSRPQPVAAHSLHTPAKHYPDGSMLFGSVSLVVNGTAFHYCSSSPEGEKNAAEAASVAVRACNSHAALVAAGKRALLELDRCKPGPRGQDAADIAGARETLAYALASAIGATATTEKQARSALQLAKESAQ